MEVSFGVGSLCLTLTNPQQYVTIHNTGYLTIALSPRHPGALDRRAGKF